MSNKLDTQHIDFLVAKKIMGWDLTATGGGEFGWREWIDANSWTVIPQRNWKPSTEIADVWKVMEKFPFGQWAVILASCERGWQCKIYSLDGPEEYSIAETAPLAISLAALKAAGVDVTEFAP